MPKPGRSSATKARAGRRSPTPPSDPSGAGLCYGLCVPPEPTPAPVKLSWRERLQEYGAVGMVVYLVIWVLTVIGFYVAISAGIEIEGVVGESSTLFAAWVAAKVTQPLRIAIVLAVTPVVAALWHRVRGRPIKGVPTPPSLPATEGDTRPDP